MAGQLTGTRVFMCVYVHSVYRPIADRGSFVSPAPVHIGQFLEAGAPVIEVIIVLVSRAGRVKRADRARCGAAALVVKHQQAVIRGRCGVIVRSS